MVKEILYVAWKSTKASANTTTTLSVLLVECGCGYIQMVLSAQDTKYNLPVLGMSGDSHACSIVDGSMLPAKSTGHF